MNPEYSLRAWTKIRGTFNHRRSTLQVWTELGVQLTTSCGIVEACDVDVFNRGSRKVLGQIEIKADKTTGYGSIYRNTTIRSCTGIGKRRCITRPVGVHVKIVISSRDGRPQNHHNHPKFGTEWVD